jgi:hypothetical protein
LRFWFGVCGCSAAAGLGGFCSGCILFSELSLGWGECGWRGDLGVSDWKVRGKIFLGVLKWARRNDGFYLAGQVGSGGFARGVGAPLSVGRAVECVICETNLGNGFVFENLVMRVTCLPGFESTGRVVGTNGYNRSLLSQNQSPLQESPKAND